MSFIFFPDNFVRYCVKCLMIIFKAEIGIFLLFSIDSLLLSGSGSKLGLEFLFRYKPTLFLGDVLFHFFFDASSSYLKKYFATVTD